MTNKELANLIFPEITETVEDLEKRFPQRDLKEGAEVTRFAPSPTGFLHTGSLFTSLICRKVATQSGGVFYVRLEDTDTKREIEGSGNQLLEQLKIFNIIPDEGYYGDYQKGNYGPYVQSERADIYKTVIKSLIEQGKAYPCFCSPEDIEEIRKSQEAVKENPGYYGKYAKCRFLTADEAASRIQAGEKYVLRFRSQGDHNKKIQVHDLIRGDFEIAQNDQDIVILKSDGLPTYHFAHAVDDHFMRTTTVIRGEEWISSLPIHVELFEQLGWKAPKYAHLPVIMKLDNGNKRKLSKRKDSEAAVSFFINDGYPPIALTMYLMTIANSNFEAWIQNNKYEGMDDFEFSFSKMSREGALFDLGKVNFFAREILGKMKKEEISSKAYEYAKSYNKELEEYISRDYEKFQNILNIEREKENPRKDYEKFGNMLEIIGFFYDDYFANVVKEKGYEFSLEKFDNNTIKEVLTSLRDGLDISLDEQSWFANMKEIGEKLGFAPNGKTFKNNPGMYKGTVGDVAELLRVTLTGRKTCPNPYYVMNILGKEKCVERFNSAISLF